YPQGTDWISPRANVLALENERISLFCDLSVPDPSSSPETSELGRGSACPVSRESWHSGSLCDTVGALRTIGGVISGYGGHCTMDCNNIFLAQVVVAKAGTLHT
ncbi:unnamed protein product, partial [Ectocarpus sp. 12 AP-2014]